MIFLPKGGVVIDTPGMREFHIWDASQGAKETFPEIEALAPGCHFRDCTHTKEKDCACSPPSPPGRCRAKRHEKLRQTPARNQLPPRIRKTGRLANPPQERPRAHRVFNKQD